MYADRSTVYAGRILNIDVNCTGTEQSLSDCDVSQRLDSSCDGQDVEASLRCIIQSKKYHNFNCRELEISKGSLYCRLSLVH